MRRRPSFLGLNVPVIVVRIAMDWRMSTAANRPIEASGWWVAMLERRVLSMGSMDSRLVQGGGCGPSGEGSMKISYVEINLRFVC